MHAEALERELSVRKIERYVDELERLRRSDEERARLEAERARTLEAERQRIEEDRQRALLRSDADAKQRASGWGASTTFGESRPNAPPASKTRPPTSVEILRDTGDRSN